MTTPGEGEAAPPAPEPPGSSSPLIDIVNDIIADAHEGALTLGDVLDDLGDRSYGPLFFLLGLIILTPIGAVPGVPIVIGAALSILAVQFIFGLRHPWMPQRFRRLSVPEHKVRAAHRKIGPVLRLIDRVVKERLTVVVSRPARVVAAAAIILLSATMAPLEVVPFGVAAPAAAIASIGLAILARDGLLMLIALGFVAGTGWLVASASTAVFASIGGVL